MPVYEAKRVPVARAKPRKVVGPDREVEVGGDKTREDLANQVCTIACQSWRQWRRPRMSRHPGEARLVDVQEVRARELVVEVEIEASHAGKVSKRNTLVKENRTPYKHHSREAVQRHSPVSEEVVWKIVGGGATV